jgi:nucleoside-diphosphate-sugar epimerase
VSRSRGFLRRAGYEVAGFDRVGGADVLDLAAVSRAARGCAAIVHLAALAHDSAGSPEQIMAVNVLGTWHVLLAAEAARANRVISFSSAQVFGIAEGERLPDHFPVDDTNVDLSGLADLSQPGSAFIPAAGRQFLEATWSRPDTGLRSGAR